MHIARRESGAWIRGPCQAAVDDGPGRAHGGHPRPPHVPRRPHPRAQGAGPLHYASQQDHGDVVRYLWTEGARGDRADGKVRGNWGGGGGGGGDH